MDREETLRQAGGSGTGGQETPGGTGRNGYMTGGGGGVLCEWSIRSSNSYSEMAVQFTKRPHRNRRNLSRRWSDGDRSGCPTAGDGGSGGGTGYHAMIIQELHLQELQTQAQRQCQ